MAEETRSERKRGSWPKKIGLIVGVLLLVLVLLYAVATSSAFFKSVILPRVSASLNAEITVDSASISPFSQVTLQGLQVKTTGPQPLLTADLVRARYSLMDIIGGNINVREVTLEKPVVQVIVEPDGSSNLDPLLKKEDQPQEDKPSSDEPTQLNLQNFSLKNGLVRQLQKQPGGASNVMELRDLNITLDQLGNGQSGKLNISSALTLLQTQPGTNDVLQGSISGGYEIALTEELLPQRVEGATTLEVNQGQGAYADLTGVNASLVANMEPTAIREIAIRLARGDQQLGIARMHGPINLDQQEARLQVELVSIDRNMLNLATAGSQWDFQKTTFNSTNQIQISQNGTFVAASGNLAGRDVSIQQQDLITPPTNLDVDYQFTVDLQKSSAVLQKLNVTGQYENREFLRTSLDQQMNISWGAAVQGFREASLRMVLTNFNLADWRALIGTNISSGVVNMNMALVAQNDGKLLRTTVRGGIQDLSAQFDTNQVQGADVTFAANGTIEDLKTVNFPEYSLALGIQGNRALQASGALRMNTQTGDKGAQLTAEGALPTLLQIISVPDLTASSGIIKFAANYTETTARQTAVGNVALENFTGRFQEYPFQDYRVAAEYNVELASEKVSIRRVGLAFNQAFQSGGSIDLTGNYDLNRETGRFEFKTVELNQTTFRPFLSPHLGENKLVSISLNASGNAVLDPQAETSVKAEAQVSNWVVQDSAGASTQPLSAGFNLDAAMQKEVLTLRQLRLKLSPTDRASNELTMQGKLDLSTNSPGPSTLELRSDSFDVTPYYDMFAASPAPAASPETAPAQPAPSEPTGPETEPEPMDLPFKDLVADLQIDRFYLRQIAISNWVGKITMKDNQLLMDPFRMQVNGGDVNFTANVNTGVPGYRYDVSFATDNVPLEPLANSLGEPNQQGRLQGTVLARGEIKGAGVTGPSLQKNLAGAFNLNLTNMNYQIVGPRLRRVLVPIALALRVPELAESPVNWAAADAQIGSGKVDLQRFAVESEAFFAQSGGEIILDQVLTNSALNLPLDLSLRRSLAIKARVASSSVPEDQKFVQLPRFVTVEGTLGAPEPNINKLALTGVLLQAAEKAGIGSDKVEGVLGDLGNILTGQNQAGGTNAPGTNQSAGNILRGLGGLLGGDKQNTSTNATTNTPPANENPAGNLLRGLGGLLGGKADQNTGTTNPPANPPPPQP